jgi:hypothetical protein
MKNKLKISEKDARLLILLFALIIFAASYFLVYTKNVEKTKDINSSNKELQQRVNELEGMQADALDKQKEIETFEKEIAKIKEKFPSQIRTEDNIVLVDQLENNADMKVSSESFIMNQIFYPNLTGVDSTAGSTNESNSESVSNDGTTDTTTAADNTAVADTSEGETSNTSLALIGYKSTTTITYQTTYEGLKKAIDYIYNNSNIMNISDLTATYDSSTGNIMGSMSINAYSLFGTGKKYEEPFIDGINTGIRNIFGTIK